MLTIPTAGKLLWWWWWRWRGRLQLSILIRRGPCICIRSIYAIVRRRRNKIVKTDWYAMYGSDTDGIFRILIQLTTTRQCPTKQSGGCMESIAKQKDVTKQKGGAVPFVKAESALLWPDNSGKLCSRSYSSLARLCKLGEENSCLWS
jgi:hypothetical protein